MDDLDLLRHEFSAEDGSFLLQLRVDLHWDRRAFTRLEQAMRRVCAQHESREQLDRWLAEGYWYTSDFVAAHISHPDFPRPEPAEYYQSAVRRLWDLQNWFVTGRSPYLASHHWPTYEPVSKVTRRIKKLRVCRTSSEADVSRIK